MNREKFDNFIENYDSKDEILVSQMALLIEKYPYFQLPRFFLTKSLKDQNKNGLDMALNQLALYTANRGLLKQKIESKVKSTKKVKDTKPSITTKKIQNNLQAIAKEKKLKSQSNKKVRFSKDLKLSFLDWIKYTEKIQYTQIQESKKFEPLKNKLSIIDRFIEADPKISPMEKNEPIESLINGDFNSEELMTESLAKILLRQKKYKKAIKAYKILSLKYPEKNVFFAGQIQKIKKLQQ
ncbi:MAG: hypothetical protein VXZ22_04465 [Bacteroidota bacterium]|nr:hypothetical protein [Bacteroidota bacterium]